MNRKIKYILGISIISSMLLVACGNDHENEAKVPTSATEYKDAHYQDVVTELENAGFTNIEMQEIDDLVTGWLTKEGEIERVSINGETDFVAGNYYPKDTKVVVSYHTFPEEAASQDEVEEEPSEAQDEQQGTETATEIITAENNPEFATVLSEEASLEQIIDFGNNYEGQTISFSAHIAELGDYDKDYEEFEYMNDKENAVALYDILIYLGDYETTTAVGKSYGPSFMFKGVNYQDMNPLNATVLQNNQNVYITAEIKEYREDLNMFFLEPKSIELR